MTVEGTYHTAVLDLMVKQNVLQIVQAHVLALINQTTSVFLQECTLILVIARSISFVLLTVLMTSTLPTIMSAINFTASTQLAVTTISANSEEDVSHQIAKDQPKTFWLSMQVSEVRLLPPAERRKKPSQLVVKKDLQPILNLFLLNVKFGVLVVGLNTNSQETNGSTTNVSLKKEELYQKKGAVSVTCHSTKSRNTVLPIQTQLHIQPQVKIKSIENGFK